MKHDLIGKRGIVVAVISAATLTFGQSGDLAGFRTMVNTKLTEMSLAMSAKDIKWFEKNLGSNFATVDVKNRSTNRQGTLAGILQSYKQFEKITVQTTILEVARGADTGTANVRQVFYGRMAPNAKGEKNFVKVVTVSQDTWERSGSDWRLVKSKETSNPIYFLNDRPVPIGTIPKN